MWEVMTIFKLEKINILILNNYLIHVDKSIKSQFYCLLSFIKRLFVARVFYVKYSGQADMLFFDFDNRIDHEEKVKKYVNQFNFKLITVANNSEFDNDKAVEIKLPLSKFNYYELLKFSWNESRKNNIPIIIFIDAVFKYISFYMLGLRISNLYSPLACFSLNFALVPGFTTGLKSISTNTKFVSIQHGFAADSTNTNSGNGWKDYFSDYHVFWNNTFKEFYHSKLSENCTSVIFGNPEYFDVYSHSQTLNSNLDNKYEGKNILFLSSYSSSSNKEIIKNEWVTINHLHNIAKINNSNLTVRYHPSINEKSNSLFIDDCKTISFEYSPNKSLAASIDDSDIIITCNSTAIGNAFLKNKLCIICEYVSKNILNINFPVLNVYSNDEFDLGKIVDKYSVTSSEAINLLYGEKTNEFEDLIKIIKNTEGCNSDS